VAQSGDDTGRLLEAHHAMWSTLGQMGATRATLDHLERGVALYDRARHAPLAFVYGGHDAGSCSLAHLTITRWQLGYPDQALAAAREAQRLTDVLQHPPSTIPALWSAVWVEYERGDREAAIAGAQRLLALASAHGLSRWMDEPTCVLTLASGRGITAADLTRVERRLAETWGARGIWRDIAAIYRLAMACGDAGQVERGLATLESIAREHGDAFYAPEIRRTRGELLLRRAAADEAEQCFRDAIEIARRRGEKALELRAAMSLGRLLSGKGQRAEARDVLGETYGWFTEGFDTADLTAARALLGQLAGGRATPG
jgi:predicted ATPase